MNICILAIGNPILWVGRYVTAFRALGNVLTVGPPLGPERMQLLGLDPENAPAYANDIETPLGKEVVLEAVLPAGWVPDLIVAISNFGVPLTPEMRTLDCPRVYISVDTWQCPLDYMDALQFHFVFAAQRAFVKSLRETGSRHVYWLPLGCDPETHYPVDTPRTCDVSFAGSVAPGVHDVRGQLLAALSSRFRVERVANVYGHDYCQALCAGALTFNHAAVKDLNMRVFEAMSMGVPLLTNRDAEYNGLLDLFEDGKHLIVYDGEEDLLEKTAYYLAKPDATRAIADEAYREVRARHTYVHRVEEILRVVGEAVPGFPKAPANRKSAGRLLLRHLPWGARRVLDVGLHLGGERDRLRAMGVTEFIGAGTSAAPNGDGWDAIHEWPLPEVHSGAMDAVLVTMLDGHAPERMLAEAARALSPGGTLLMSLEPEEFEKLCGASNVEDIMATFRRMDCHATGLMIAYGPDGSGPEYLLIGRRRTRTLHDVVVEGLAELDIQHDQVLQWVKRLPADQ